MKILHFSWEYPPVMFGGLGAHVVELTREQVRQGNEVVVVTQQSDPPSPVRELIDGVMIVRADNYYPEISFAQETLGSWVNGFALGSFRIAREFVRNWIPDLVHGHDWVGAQQAQLLSGYLNIPQVITIHATEFGRHQGWISSQISHVVHARELKAIQQANQIIVCSTYMKNELVNSLFADPNKISVVPNGIDLEGIEPIVSDYRDVSAEDRRVFTIGFLGRVEWEKGAHHVIDALKVLSHTRYRVKIIGVGSQLSDLKEKVRRNGLGDQVDFLGYVSTDRKRALLAECNAIVVPSTYEPFGIVALEAGAVGVPLIVSQVGGLRDVAPSLEYAYLLEQITGEAIADSVREIESDPRDASVRARNFANRVKDIYNWTSVAHETAIVYQLAVRNVHV